MTTFAARLKAARKLRRISQIDLADQCGLTSGAICNFEHRRSLPSLSVLIAIADALEVKIDYLLGRDAYT